MTYRSLVRSRAHATNVSLASPDPPDSRSVAGGYGMVPRMTPPIRRVAVLGAGVMGSGIAAHCANAGIPVLLLDIVPPDGKGGRNAFAAGALEKLKKAKPAAL